MRLIDENGERLVLVKRDKSIKSEFVQITFSDIKKDDIFLWQNKDDLIFRLYHALSDVTVINKELQCDSKELNVVGIAAPCFQTKKDYLCAIGVSPRNNITTK